MGFAVRAAELVLESSAAANAHKPHKRTMRNGRVFNFGLVRNLLSRSLDAAREMNERIVRHASIFIVSGLHRESLVACRRRCFESAALGVLAGLCVRQRRTQVDRGAHRAFFRSDRWRSE